jgi:hypothetical protein
MIADPLIEGLPPKFLRSMLLICTYMGLVEKGLPPKFLRSMLLICTHMRLVENFDVLVSGSYVFV